MQTCFVVKTIKNPRPCVIQKRLLQDLQQEPSVFRKATWGLKISRVISSVIHSSEGWGRPLSDGAQGLVGADTYNLSDASAQQQEIPV